MEKIIISDNSVTRAKIECKVLLKKKKKQKQNSLYRFLNFSIMFWRKEKMYYITTAL